MLIQEARIRTDSAGMLYASAAVFQIWMPRWQKSQQPKLLPAVRSRSILDDRRSEAQLLFPEIQAMKALLSCGLVRAHINRNVLPGAVNIIL
tara:strand:+ start:28 stop:303 length:276 start_codon:yes stop_codon:yes gene_type:complete